MSLVLYECQGRAVTLREEQRLMMLDNRVLTRVLGPERVGVTGGQGNLLNKELNPLTPELNPSANAACRDFLVGILIFKGLTARRLYKSL
jgi:hypothetical protein